MSENDVASRARAPERLSLPPELMDLPTSRPGHRHVALLSLLLSLTCACGANGAGARPSPSPSPPVVFGFAGVSSNDRIDEVKAIRATISWTIEPVVVRGYSVSTWIAFAIPTPGHGVSNRIAQIGWIETDPGDPRLFWEWGLSSTETHRQIGKPVQRGVPLAVELDMASDGTLSFLADGVAVGSATVPWTPTAIGGFVETHIPSEYLPGSATQPEILARFEEEVAGNWTAYSGQVFTTNPQFRVSVASDRSIRIWDDRQPT
jgi:hypothetical protein